MKLLLDKLTWAFTALGFEEPKHEAKLLTQLTEIMSIEMLRDNLFPEKEYQGFLFKKYNL